MGCVGRAISNRWDVTSLAEGESYNFGAVRWKGYPIFTCTNRRFDLEPTGGRQRGYLYQIPLPLPLPLSPYVSGPNSVKIATPLRDLEAKDININKTYLVSCTNSRASDLAAASKVFNEASEAGKPAKIAQGVEFYIAAASIPE